ncbi:SDR family NAD(P)-dependent oxidoreductase [Dactylosporangium sucinum]|uniref:SDR family NAD(P)-dependent oxidoreductase n=1 Tax=Dactylosporangium sucinum TaxID=1424081 RepID=UPI001E3DA00D|nr:SDR family oxidoreductase [Dactylosporangium sucinum]
MASSTRFAGVHAIVTGGARGIGFATVAALLRESAAVTFCDRDRAAGEQALGLLPARAPATFVHADVAVEADVAAVVARGADAYGPPTVLVNNAGVNANFDAVEMSSDEWDDFFAVDLKASWLFAKYCLPHMTRAGGGAIVNVSSIHGTATLEGFFPYAAAKSGLLGLTRSLALDYGRHGVRVNVVMPGFTRTRLVRESIDRHDDPAAAEARMVGAVAIGRIAEPEEVASVIVFLASSEASYVTGASIAVDGGLAARRSGA